MTWQSTELRFAEDHPTAAGHFPFNPIIPGALLLDGVVAAISGADYGGAILIRSAKFLHIVRPGESLSLRWQPVAAGGIKFECRLAGQDELAVSGMLEIGAA